MIEWLQHNWFLVGALGTLFGFSLDKGYNFWKDRKEKQQAYNRLFTAVTRLYFSFLRNSRMYNNETIPQLLGDYLKPVIEESDTLTRDLNEYKLSIQKESELLPEFGIIANELFDSLDTFSLMDSLYKRLDSKNEIDGSSYFNLKKVLYQTITPKFDSYFKGTLDILKNKISISDKMYEQLYNISMPAQFNVETTESINIMLEKLSNTGMLNNELLAMMKNATQNSDKK